jgi:DNA-binding IscR family transcriptional regulator
LIAKTLKEKGFIESVRGPGGGYKVPEHALERSVQEITDIFESRKKLFYCNPDKQHSKKSINARIKLAEVTGYYYRHMNSLTIKQASLLK